MKNIIKLSIPYTGVDSGEMIAQELDRVGKTDYAYVTLAERAIDHFRETIRTVTVAAIVLAAIVIFLKGNTMWMTLLAFAIGLSPFVIAAIIRDRRPKTRNYRHSESSGDTGVDDDSNWVWGVNNADGSYGHH